jgi:hypothetical protein
MYIIWFIKKKYLIRDKARVKYLVTIIARTWLPYRYKQNS